MGKLWNLPVETFPQRYRTLVELFSNHFGERPIDVLEIGVFRADLIQQVFKSELVVGRYDGVDPFLGDKDDPYTGGYWQNEKDAEGFFAKAELIFSNLGQHCFRCKSEDFLKHPDRLGSYDLVIVDGNHQYQAALKDMNDWFPFVRSGGLMLIDDYANVDHPGVTRAINEFISTNESKIGKAGYKTIEFQNKGKHIPVVLSFVYFTPIQ